MDLALLRKETLEKIRLERKVLALTSGMSTSTIESVGTTTTAAWLHTALGTTTLSFTLRIDEHDDTEDGVGYLDEDLYTLDAYVLSVNYTLQGTTTKVYIY